MSDKHTTWSTVSDDERTCKTVERWLYGEQPSSYTQYAGERLTYGNNDRYGGYEGTDSCVVEDNHEAWSEVTDTASTWSSVN